MNKRSPPTPALWEAIVVRAEALHDVAVLGQRRATAATARRMQQVASEIVSLASAAVILGAKRKDDA